MKIEISKAYDGNGRLVACLEGATWLADERADLSLAHTFRSYRILFELYDEAVTIHAADDDAAIELARATYHGPWEMIRRSTDDWDIVHEETT